MLDSHRYENDLPSRSSALAKPPQFRTEPLFEMLAVRNGNDGPVTREIPGTVAGCHSFATRRKFWKVKFSPSGETRSCWSPFSRLVNAPGPSLACGGFKL